MKRYFDAHVYVANWGSRVLMLKIPKEMIDMELVWPYCNDETLSAQIDGEFVIFRFSSEVDGMSDWDGGEGWSASLLPLREALINGDLRALYLGWLAGIWVSDEDEEEPPVPPGLRQLNGPLNSLTTFLIIPEQRLAAAQQADAVAPPAGPTAEDQAVWLANWPISEKDGLLRQLISGEKPPSYVASQIRQHFQRDWKLAHPMALTMGDTPRRTIKDLLKIAEALEAEEERLEAERKAKAQAENARVLADARKRHLTALAGQGARPWLEVESLMATTALNNYKRAVQLLTDLRGVAEMNSTAQDWRERVLKYRGQYFRKSSLMRQFDQAGLPS